LVVVLSGSNVVLEVLMKVIQFHHELTSPCGGKVSFGMRSEVWVVTFVGIEREIPVVAHCCKRTPLLEGRTSCYVGSYNRCGGTVPRSG
jgi:hypothetical protein